jgi:threonine dehydrogenase-like Zn-dependent dehydrogenase
MAQKTRALRLYGAADIRMEEFTLSELKDDEILVRVITDSICMSTYKLLCAIPPKYREQTYPPTVPKHLLRV